MSGPIPGRNLKASRSKESDSSLVAFNYHHMNPANTFIEKPILCLTPQADCHTIATETVINYKMIDAPTRTTFTTYQCSDDFTFSFRN